MEFNEFKKKRDRLYRIGLFFLYGALAWITLAGGGFIALLANSAGLFFLAVYLATFLSIIILLLFLSLIVRYRVERFRKDYWIGRCPATEAKPR